MLPAHVSPSFPPKSVLSTHSRLYAASAYTTFLPHTVARVPFEGAGRNIGKSLY